MNICFVLANKAQIDPAVDIQKLKTLGSFWGGWPTWRSYQTDNVVCHDLLKAKELIDRDFQNTCNFFISNAIYKDLDRPSGVRLYEGEFKHDLDNHEDIVAMHLAASTSDIVLLLGFDFATQEKNPDRLTEHKAHNYRSLTKQAILNNSKVQWVILDHPAELRKDLQTLSNFGKDTLQNIIQTLC